MPKPKPFIHVFEKMLLFFFCSIFSEGNRTEEADFWELSLLFQINLIQPKRIQIFPLWCLSIFASGFLKKDQKRKEYGLALTNALM